MEFETPIKQIRKQSNNPPPLIRKKKRPATSETIPSIKRKLFSRAIRKNTPVDWIELIGIMVKSPFKK